MKSKCIIDADGNKEWWVDGKRHRLDGPAIEYNGGSKEWWVDGKLHRIDGPAIEPHSGTNEWYLNGNELLIEEVEKWIKDNNINLKTIEGQLAFKMRWS